MIVKLFDRFGLRMSWQKPELPPDMTPEMLKSLRQQVLSHETLILTDRAFADTRFIVFDTETTGFHPFAGDEIISLSAVTLEGKRCTLGPVFDRLVNPYRLIPPAITELTAITQGQTDQAASLLRILPDFLEFAGNHVWVGHPAAFDLNFINAKLRRYCNCKVKHHVIDMMKVAYHLYPGWQDYSLERFAAYYGIPVCNRHRSLADAQLTAEIWCRFLGELEIRGIHTLYSLNLYMKGLL